MAYFVTCRVGREWYGIPIDHVLEVLHLVALNEAPNSSKVGVMTLRERVISVLDLRQFFEVVDYEYSLDTPIIAIQYGDEALGLIVDETDNVVEADMSQAQAYRDPGIETVLRVDERMIFILDAAYFFKVETSLELD